MPHIFRQRSAGSRLSSHDSDSPEKVALWGKAPEGQHNLIQAKLQSVQFLGDRYEYTVALGSETRVLVSPATRRLKAGEKVFLELKSEGISLWPREG